MELLALLQNTPKSPCDRFKCEWRSACALGLACEAFAVFVETGRANNPPMPPSVEFYKLAFEIKQ